MISWCGISKIFDNLTKRSHRRKQFRHCSKSCSRSDHVGTEAPLSQSEFIVVAFVFRY